MLHWFFFRFVCFCIGLSHCFMFMPKSLAHSFTTDSAFTKPLGNLCLTLTPHIWSRIGDFGLVSQLLVCRCKNVSLSLHFQALAPDDLGGFGLFCYSLILTEAPPVPPQTHTHSNNGDDTPFQQLCSRPYEMGQWKSPHLQNHSHDASAFLCSSHYSAPLSLP